MGWGHVTKLLVISALCVATLTLLFLQSSSVRQAAVPSFVLTQLLDKVTTKRSDVTSLRETTPRMTRAPCTCLFPEPIPDVADQKPESLLETLTREFQHKLTLPSVKPVAMPSYCDLPDSRSNSCNGTCRRLSIDPDVSTRVAQLYLPPHLRLTPEYAQVLEDMGAKVKGHYDVIIATAVSDNHFDESQPMILNLKINLFPHLKNFTFVYYNLGLSPERRSQLEQHCQCQVIDFPFERFPNFFENLHCYTWKPVIIKAHLKQSQVLVWADASVRFDKGPDAFQRSINATRERGFQFRIMRSSDVASRTVPSMFHFFGEEACAYLGLGEIQATYGFYSNDRLVDRLVLEPWVACALSRDCMCPDPFPERKAARSRQMVSEWNRGKSPLIYGLAHRFDQSALNILVMKLYRERYLDTQDVTPAISIRRGDTSQQLPQPPLSPA